MKQIDPDTGLIYFKYDFGYEFGIVLPGEGKKTITSTNKTIQGQRRASDIEVPIVHEFTTKKENGYAKKGTTTSSSSTRSTKSATTKFGPSKTVKWEPTSESEFSEAEDTKNARRRYPGVGGDTMPPPPSLVIPCSPSPSRWDHTTPSPLSLSPSLPSLSPRYSSATGPPSNVDSAGIYLPSTLCLVLLYSIISIAISETFSAWFHALALLLILFNGIRLRHCTTYTQTRIFLIFRNSTGTFYSVKTYKTISLCMRIGQMFSGTSRICKNIRKFVYRVYEERNPILTNFMHSFRHGICDFPWKVGFSLNTLSIIALSVSFDAVYLESGMGVKLYSFIFSFILKSCLI